VRTVVDGGVEVDCFYEDFATNDRGPSVVAGDATAYAEEPGADVRAVFEFRHATVNDEEDLLAEVHGVGIAHTEPPQRTPNEAELGLVELTKRWRGTVRRGRGGAMCGRHALVR
jgi:hypothetical protein